MLQDIGPHIYDNNYIPKPPQKHSYALCYEDQKVLLIRDTHGMRLPTFQDLEVDNSCIYEEWTYLFAIDADCFYLVKYVSTPSLSQFTMENTQVFRTMNPQYLAFAGITGFQLYRWYESRHYCGKCGKPMTADEKERMVYCPACHQIEYPRISPAVIVGITDGNRLLLSKYAGRDYKKYALIAGFTEIGESVEETVCREVLEEVGLKVKNIRYYKSQPWSFTDTLLIGFFADLDGAEDITLDREELALAQWFEREDIPVTEKSISLTNEMILAFKCGGKNI